MTFHQQALITLQMRVRKPKSKSTKVSVKRYSKYDDGTDAEFITHTAAARADMY